VILHFAVFIFAPFIRGHAEGTNWGTLSRVAQLGIATEISHDDHFVKGHEEPFFYWDYEQSRYYKRGIEEASNCHFET
jgi:hypothetical protein